MEENSFVCKTGTTGITVREVQTKECPWLESTVAKGLAVFKYLGPEWGVISSSGIAVCLEPKTFPFIELPKDSILWD